MKKLYFGILCSLMVLMSSTSFAQDERLMTVQHLSGGTSYFSINVQDNGLLNGTYPGWCADWTKNIEDGVSYPVKFYSTYSQMIPAELVDHPENLDSVNWILNQHFVGKTAPGDLGVYTSGDVQLAIWSLLQNTFDSSTVGPFSQARVDLIVQRALTEGEGFYPTCKQIVGIILDPGTAQSTIIEIKVKKFHKCVIPDNGK